MNGLLQKILKKDKKRKIEFCQNNLDKFIDKESIPLFQTFINSEHVSMKEYTCLSECELCAAKPYAKVNGEIVSAENSKELIDKLKLI
ncbi:DUF1450 domain-containing protein [Bacillus sp. V3B]|uniref:DUF1450 domain-containing protein n=1 Tax=Bacillus sp. V3B TaxID=2804915 RepID=UPI00210EAE5C|nr:DUF1450 domain-containing protein [Bacillus sp. V3B]MCQ6276526.1 DUF1450 domain-containing protein [Bacillus sp. V3B]